MNIEKNLRKIIAQTIQRIKIHNDRITYEQQKFKNRQLEKEMQNLEIRNGSLRNAIKVNKIFNSFMNEKKT